MLITLLIASLLVGIAVPSLRFFVVNSKLSTGTNSLVIALNLARSEAVTRSVPVSVCPSTTGTNCTSTAWSQGWIVFVDEDVAGTVDGADLILLRSDGFSSDVNVSLVGPPYLQFQPTGSLVDECGVECLHGPDKALLAANDGAVSLPLLLWLLPGTAAYAAPPDGPPGQGAANGQGVGNGQGNGQGQGVAVGLGGENPGLGPNPGFATFNLCNGGTGRTITVNSVGRVRVADSSC
jgi:Tfp pilus assembly protein FimT